MYLCIHTGAVCIIQYASILYAAVSNLRCFSHDTQLHRATLTVTCLMFIAAIVSATRTAIILSFTHSVLTYCSRNNKLVDKEQKVSDFIQNNHPVE